MYCLPRSEFCVWSLRQQHVSGVDVRAGRAEGDAAEVDNDVRDGNEPWRKLHGDLSPVAAASAAIRLR